MQALWVCAIIAAGLQGGKSSLRQSCCQLGLQGRTGASSTYRVQALCLCSSDGQSGTIQHKLVSAAWDAGRLGGLADFGHVCASCHHAILPQTRYDWTHYLLCTLLYISTALSSSGLKVVNSGKPYSIRLHMHCTASGMQLHMHCTASGISSAVVCLGHNKFLQSPSTDPIVGIMRWEESFCTWKGCKHLLRLLHQFCVEVARRRFQADVLDS